MESERKKVDIDHLRVGNVLAADIYNQDRILLAKSGIHITEELLSQIQTLGLNEVEIYDYIDQLSQENRPIFSHVIRKAICENLEQAYEDLGSENVMLYSKKASNLLVTSICKSDVEVCMEDLLISNEYTFRHSIGVAGLAILIGNEMKMSKEELETLGAAGLLHDVGKTKISNEILDKPGKLTKEEFEIIKTHPILGYEMLKSNQYIPDSVRLAVLEHHEKQDGSGYPFGLKGNQISPYGKIIAVADVFDALVTERVYHDPFPASEAIEMMMGSPDHFDNTVLKAFLSSITIYPIGTVVCLSNGEIARVVKNYKDACLRPVVEGITDGHTYDLRNALDCASIIIL